MGHNETLLIAIRLFLEILGLALLAREVDRGRRMENVESEFTFLRQLQYLYATQDYRGFFTLVRLDHGDTPEMAGKLATAAGHALQEAVESEWRGLSDRLASGLARWEKSKLLGQKSRRTDLIIGTSCLMAAAIMHSL
jgi:hypothetical protein